MSTDDPGLNEFGGSLFDFQVNGFAGVYFQRLDLCLNDLLSAVTAFRQHGAGCFLSTRVTDGIDALCCKLTHAELRRATNDECYHVISGYHIEGPWLNPADG